jgi:hypothetical protein
MCGGAEGDRQFCFRICRGSRGILRVGITAVVLVNTTVALLVNTVVRGSRDVIG